MSLVEKVEAPNVFTPVSPAGLVKRALLPFSVAKPARPIPNERTSVMVVIGSVARRANTPLLPSTRKHKEMIIKFLSLFLKLIPQYYLAADLGLDQNTANLVLTISFFLPLSVLSATMVTI